MIAMKRKTAPSGDDVLKDQLTFGAVSKNSGSTAPMMTTG
jgi:hypothetical protein